MKKGNVSVWSKDVYTITTIKDKQYLINDHRQRVWNRWELLKIEGAQGIVVLIYIYVKDL